MGKLIDQAKGKFNAATGQLKQHSADPATRDEGQAQELKGKAQQLKGQVKGLLGDDI